MAVHKLETFSLGSTERQPFMKETEWSLSWHSGFNAGTFTFEVTAPNGGPSEKVTVDLVYSSLTKQFRGGGKSKDGTTYTVVGKRELVDADEVVDYHFFVGLCTTSDFSDDDDVDGFTAIDQGPGEEPPVKRKKRFFGLL